MRSETKELTDMNTPVPTTASPAAAPYWVELEGLSDNVQLELIMLLSGSLVSPDAAKSKSSEGWADRFCGAWEDHRSAEEIMEDIRGMQGRK